MGQFSSINRLDGTEYGGWGQGVMPRNIPKNYYSKEFTEGQKETTISQAENVKGVLALVAMIAVVYFIG